MICIDILIINSSETPIYQQIADQIKGSILRGELGSEEPLPSIRVLAKELQISVITTKRAYEELEKEGLIYTRPGKGSFVVEHGECVLEESKQRVVKEKMKEALDAAVLIGMSKSDLRILFNRMMEGE